MAESLRCKVEKHLTCCVCLEPFEDPKVLPCLHSYCHKCIMNLVNEAAPSTTIYCPECRLAVEVVENTITLPSNFFVNNLLATMALTTEEPDAKKIVCDNCDKEEVAQNRCNECGIFLCQFCTESHKRSRSTKHHELLTMEELKSNPGAHNIAERIRCSKHKEEMIKLFCKTCQTTICRDCTIVDHQGHKYDFIEQIASEEKQRLQQNLNDVKQRKDRLVEGIVDLKKLNENLEAKKDSTISEINKHFDELVKTVESRKQEMIDKATELTNSKQKQVHGQLEGLEVALASCDSSIEFTEQALKNGNDVQILSMEKYILQCLEQLKTVKDQTKPCVTRDMMFLIPSSVQETKEKLQNECDIHDSVVNPGNCKAFVKGVEMSTRLTPGKRYYITLVCNDENNERLKYGQHVIKPLFTGMDVDDVVVSDNKDGSYDISFCLRKGGMMKFEVSVDGVPAPSCTLTKQVKWVISNVYGIGPISGNGFKMSGVNGVYSWRVGYCYFESGVYTWTVQVASSFDADNNQGEVGIVDCDNGMQKLAVYERWVKRGSSVDISLTVDMKNKTLTIKEILGCNKTRTVKTCRFTARRVSPFFASSSSLVSLQIVA